MLDTTSDIIKASFSMVLLIFSVTLISAVIFQRQTSMSSAISPIPTLIVMWTMLISCSIFEGGQASMVGLMTVDKALFKESHTVSHYLCELIHQGNNLDRYLMGRQYMVIIIVFLVDLAGAPTSDTTVLGLPDIICSIFLSSGFGMILLACMVGQLNTQVNSARCMLDFINTHFMTMTVYCSLVMEASGLIHVTYLFQMAFAKILDQPIESNEAPRNAFQNILFWSRVVFSSAVLGAAFLVTLSALAQGKTTMWEGVPVYVSIVLFLLSMALVGFLESIQISFYYVSKLTVEERNISYWSRKTSDLLFGGDGKNLQRFLIGRQLCVVSNFFIIARIITVKIPEGEGNVLGVSDELQSFFDTGLVGSFVTTICAALAWRLAATAFPMVFMVNPITYVLLRVCLVLEATGICSGAWVLAACCKKLFGYRMDEDYIGTAEERQMLKEGKDNGTVRTVRRMSSSFNSCADMSNLGSSSEEENSLDTPLLSRTPSDQLV